VVKGNAYGHGVSTFVPLAMECGLKHFSVFSADEAYQVKKVIKEEATVLIMGMMEKSQIEWAVRYPSTRMDMVRVGIMQYGFWPNTETYISYTAKRKKRIDPLKRILSWKSSQLNYELLTRLPENIRRIVI